MFRVAFLYWSIRFWVIFIFVRALIRWAFLEFFSCLDVSCLLS